MEEQLIAPCGINCYICPQYQKRKNPCVGCRTRTTRKSQTCILKNCQKECRGKSEFCADCTEFPSFCAGKRKNGPALCVEISCLSPVYTSTVRLVATHLLPNKTAELTGAVGARKTPLFYFFTDPSFVRHPVPLPTLSGHFPL